MFRRAGPRRAWRRRARSWASQTPAWYFFWWTGRLKPTNRPTLGEPLAVWRDGVGLLHVHVGQAERDVGVEPLAGQLDGLLVAGDRGQAALQLGSAAVIARR